MAEWLYEAGIGEARAALVEDNTIVRAAREWPGAGARCGAVLPARFNADLIGRRGVLVTLAAGEDALLQPVPPGFGPGQQLMVEVVRERIAAPPRALKHATVRAAPADARADDGPDLLARIAATGLPVRRPQPFGPDLLEAAGWSELMGEAATGIVAFAGGVLRIEQTEAGVTIDIDGSLDPDRLAEAGAAAAARAIGRLGLGGSVLIDLPTVSGREPRLRAAAAFDAAMTGPFERTAVNGFGLLQAVMPRLRPSLMEQLQGQPARAEALALYRRAEREPLPGAIEIAAHGDVAGHPTRADDDRELARRRGTLVRWRTSPAVPLGAGQVHRRLTPVDPARNEDAIDADA